MNKILKRKRDKIEAGNKENVKTSFYFHGPHNLVASIHNNSRRKKKIFFKRKFNKRAY